MLLSASIGLVVYLLFREAAGRSCSVESVDFHKVGCISCILLFAIWAFFSWIGPYIFDEARSVNNRPHEHLYTRIRGNWYDLARFNHPGGPVALNLAKDRDSTALFESHHLLISHDKLYGILSKYRVSDDVAKHLTTLDEDDDGAHYVWKGFECDEFVRDVKRLVVSYFTPIAQARGISIREATKATPGRRFMIFSLMLAFFATLPSFTSGRWWSLLVTPQLAWVTIANYWHDGLHFSLSTDWRVNAMLPYVFPWLSSPWMWYHQHTIGHHAYTNIGHKDPDVAHAPQLKREHQSVTWKPCHEHQDKWLRIAMVWSISVGIGLQIVSDIKTNLKLSYNNVVPYAKLSRPRMAVHMMGRLFYLASLFVWPFFAFPFWKAVIWAIFPITSFGWSFMLNSQINHLTEACSHASHANFMKHQVLTSQNFGLSSAWCRWFSGGLNHQIEHHLFPCINHCHLPSLAPEVKKLCKKHGLCYNEVSGYREALEMHIAHTANMAIPPQHT